MSDQDENQPYRDAIANLRETTKWIITSAAGLAAFLVGSNPLSSLAALDFGWRWWVAAGSSFASILLIVGVLGFAVRVVSSLNTIAFDALVQDPKYFKHRSYIETNVTVYFPANIRNLQNLRTVYNDARETADRLPTPDNVNALQVYTRYISMTLNISRWLEVTYRFRTLIMYFIIAILGTLIFIYIFIWAANPTKDKGQTQSPVALTLILNPPATPGAITPPSSSVPSNPAFDCGDQDKPFEVGPFVQGYVTLEENATNIRTLLDRLTARQNQRALIGLVMIGSADKTALLPKFAQQYGSNSGLAQARAEWVRSQLLQSDALHRLEIAPADKIAAAIAGPAHVGLDVAPAALALDRKVRVCVIWGGEQAASPH